MYVVIYRPHNTTIASEQHFGPYPTKKAAQAKLNILPSLGKWDPNKIPLSKGYKSIDQILM